MMHMIEYTPELAVICIHEENFTASLNDVTFPHVTQ